MDTVFVRPRPRDNTRLTLVCLGFCGGGTGPYLSWADVVPDDVTLAAVCYPGREGRFCEPPARTWDELAEDTSAAVLDGIDGPYVLFGHSMGGWMAFDVAARIEEAGGPPARALVVSSANSPVEGVRERDMFPAQHQTDDEVLDWLAVNGLLPDHVLGHPDLREMALDLMRADMRVRDDFRYRRGSRVSIPLHVLTGAEDTTIAHDTASKWRPLTTGDFRHDELPGGHFFTPAAWSRLPEHMRHLS
jgi:surfactin synthase thioesterase subunit